MASSNLLAEQGKDYRMDDSGFIEPWRSNILSMTMENDKLLKTVQTTANSVIEQEQRRLESFVRLIKRDMEEFEMEPLSKRVNTNKSLPMPVGNSMNITEA